MCLPFRMRARMACAISIMLGLTCSCGKLSKCSVSDGKIHFNIAEVSSTKGQVITTANIGEQYQRFITDIWVSEAGKDAAAAFGQPQHYVDKAVVNYDPDGDPYKWELSVEAYWLNDVYKCFWSWAPVEVKDTDNITSLRSIGTATNEEHGTLPFSYQLPTSLNDGTDAELQKDLLFAFNYQKLNDGETEGLVNIHFYHALSWIRFMVDKTDGSFSPELEITNISFDNLYRSADCIFDPTAAGFAEDKFRWDNHVNKGNFSQDLTIEDDFNEPYPKAPGASVSTSSKSFMLIPQTTPDDAIISITFKRSDGSTIVRSVKFNGEEWKAGLYYTYKISATSLNNPITISVSYVDWIDGGTGRI